MGNYHMSIKNETPDYYSYCFRYHPEWEGIVASGVLGPYQERRHGQREILTTVYVRYGQESREACRNNPTLQRYYNGINSPHFFIQPVGSMIRLRCSNGGDEPWCVNLGEIERQQQQEERERRRREEERRRREEEERRKREEEERRRRERIERERRIQQQISKEADALKNKLGRAAEKRRLNTNLTGRQQEHQRSHVLAQQVEDDAEGIRYEEVKLVTTKFEKLLKTYNIRIQNQSDSNVRADVGEKIKLLFDQLIGRYCAEVDLNIVFHWSFDEATRFNTCSLTDKLEIVDALLRVILKDEHACIITELEKDIVVHDKHALLIRLMAALKDTNRPLSTHLMKSCLDAFSGLSHVNKDFIEMIVYNNIWTPLEAVILLMHIAKISQDDLAVFLHMVQTYRVNISEAIVAIKSDDRMKVLQDFIDTETDKSLETVLEEMKRNGLPDHILQKLQETVAYVISELSACEGLDISSKIEKGIQDLKEIDFKNVNVAKFGQILIGLSIAVKEEMGYFPRVTQLVSVVTLLLSKTSELNGCLLEISTGEGKSCIVAMLAVILALRGSCVDVVTSSPLLAIRDVEEWSGYFAKFNLTAKAAFPLGLSDCKTPDERDALLASAYKADIVYGTVGNFAADTLRQEFEKKNIRGSRGFNAVIVDEVDYMTLDNGVQVTFLSHATSGMRHVEQVLASIWNMLSGCRPVDDAESGFMFWFTGVQHFNKAAVSALVGPETNEKFNAWEVISLAVNLGYITSADLNNLKLYESMIAKGTAEDTTKEHAQNLIDKIMRKIGIPEARDILAVLEAAVVDIAIECYKIESGRAVIYGPKGTKADKVRVLLLENGLACELLTEAELVKSVKMAIKEKMQYSWEHSMPTKEDKSSDGIIYMPQFLKHYVENRLEIFIKNALRAILMTKGREYTIDRSSAENTTDSPPHHFDCIIPVDFKASGVLEKNKRWGDGLQQFLEMKHQLSLTPLSTVTNFLSNFHFFKRYTNGTGVYGVSGTLGDKSDCSFLSKHFKVSCYPVPTHKHKKLVELPMIQIKGGEDSWIRHICQRTKSAISAKQWCKGQAALVVCEDLKTASKLQAALTNDVCESDKVTMYTRSDKHKVEGMKFGSGHVIIATNLGGRGTDISVTDDVNKSGGLFVLLTHFASNRRVEKQIFGRTARKGLPGTVQMVLSYNSLARAYQGQNIDMMRRLREEYERQRIIDMETDELLTIDIREKLFGVFCEKLSEVSRVYKAVEKQDWGSLIVRDVPVLLNVLGETQRLDFKPAQNAFKETWAHWLILNEHRIENNESVDQLKKDLESVLEKRQSELGQGTSKKFYDHTRQALGRMYLHEADHNKDCGTLAAWNRAIDADSAYRAIATYNKAYIIINMRKDGYMDDAINLLKETQQCVDVHVAENANTLMACLLSSANGKFEPHNEGETNFKRQLEIRKSFFKLWLEYTGNAIQKLQELKSNGEDAITEEKGIFALIEKPSHLEANELQELFNEGLQVVYEVKKKPRFCISALICAIIGLIQVFGGVLVCALSFGSASQIGLGLISEGVSDMVSGVIGMIQGTFDWAEWAISKAISIGISLISAGFSKIKDACCAVAKGVKGLLTGAKTLSSVADDCMRAAKTAWTSTKTAFSSAAGALSKNTLKQSVITLSSSEVAKASIKQAGKYALQEVATQAVMKGLNVGISKATEALFEKLLSDMFKSAVGKGLRESGELNNSLVQLIVCYGVPQSTLNAENPYAYSIPSSSETVIHMQIKNTCERVVPELTTDNTVINEIFTRLKEVKDEMEGILNSMDASGKLFTAATIATEIGTHTAAFVTMIQNIPTLRVIRENVVPEFKEDIDMLLRDDDAPQYIADARSSFSTVLNLKERLINILIDKVASAFTDACASNLNSFLTDFARSKLNQRINHAVHKTTGRYDVNYFFQKQQEQYHVEKLKADVNTVAGKPASEQDLNELTSRAEDTDKPPSIVEIKAMVESGQMDGKGLEIQTVDRDGTELSSVTFQGSDSAKGTIKLRIVREDVQSESEKGFFTKLKEKVMGKESPWSGRFELVSDDGKTAIKLNTDENNSLFYAVAMATYPGLSPNDAKEKASFMRSEVGDEILRNPDKYIVLHRRQKEYEMAYGEFTFFSLPPKPASGDMLRRADATVGELERSDAKVVDNSLSLTRMKVALEEKASEMWTKLVTGDKALLKSTLKFTASTIRNIAKPVGGENRFVADDDKDAKKVPLMPGSDFLMKKKLLYIPSQDILQDCGERINSRFSQMRQYWSQGIFVSMVIPRDCDDQIIASAEGSAYGVPEKAKLYETYKNLMTDCLCGSRAECNPTRLLKLAMICSNPDATLDIMSTAGLIKSESESIETELVKPEEVPEGIPEDQDPRLGKTFLLDPDSGRRMIGPWGLSDEGLDTYFKICYLVVLSKYKTAKCLDESIYEELFAWVEKDGFLDSQGKEYADIVSALKVIQ